MGCFHERHAELLFARGQGWRQAARSARAKFLARLVELEGVVLRGLGNGCGADELDDLLRQPDGMHQLDQVPGVVTGLYRELPAVLLDSFGLRRAGQVARARVS